MRYDRAGAQKVWSAASMLIIAGVSMELPHILVDDGRRGFVMIRASSQGLHDILHHSRKACATFIRNVFPDELKKVETLMEKECIKNE